ncbi:MAG: flagellar biosynthesis protein FlaG [Thermoproteus sp.]|jgi:flagellin-like protein|nr:flagellar biosynthesis protein FlaG [Thermoproteus sp.]
MRGLSEIVASVLLLVITVALSAFLLSIFYNIYFLQRGQLALAQSAQYCQARIVAVTNNSGSASIWVYNFGQTPCVFTAAYALNVAGGAAAAASVSASAGPGALASVAPRLPFGYPGYRLATNDGQTIDWWGR